MMNRPTNSIQKGGTASNGVVLSGHGLDVLNAHTVIDDLTDIIKEDSGDQRVSLGVFLFFNHGVEASDGISLKPTH